MTELRNHQTREQILASATNVVEDRGWADTPHRRGSRERLLAQRLDRIDPEGDNPLVSVSLRSPHRDRDRDRDLADALEQEPHFRHAYATLLANHPASAPEARAVRTKWESRCRRLHLDLPETTDPVEYVVECRRRYLVGRHEQDVSLEGLCNVLAELGMGFEKIRGLTDLHRVGSNTLAQIETLYEQLVLEVAQAAERRVRR